MMGLPEAKDLATILGALIALGTLFKGVVEYSRQGAQKRAESFIQMWRRVKENSHYKAICDAIDDNDPTLVALPFKPKRDLLGLFEEVALLVNSRLLRKDVAHYMFGYYAIRCWESPQFWSNFPQGKDERYWKVLYQFVSKMKAVEAHPPEHRRFRL